MAKGLTREHLRVTHDWDKDTGIDLGREEGGAGWRLGRGEEAKSGNNCNCINNNLKKKLKENNPKANPLTETSLGSRNYASTSMWQSPVILQNKISSTKSSTRKYNSVN